MATQGDFSFTRREGLLALLPSFAVFAALGEAKAAPSRDPMRGWMDGHQDIATALAAGRISGATWASEVERLAQTVDVPQLMDHVAKSRLQDSGTPSGNDPRKRYVRFIDDAGRPQRVAYGVALFDFAPSNVVTPHGHRHMVSAHMVVAGAFRVRNFNRLADEPGAMVIKATRDYIASVGDVSTMCSERDNIHWFVPRGGPATTFDIVISDLDPGQPSYEIQAVDPIRGHRRADGTISAPIIGFDQSSKLFTADV